MRYRPEQDWPEQVPDHYRRRRPYEDYGWEPGQSVLPEFRDPSVHFMPYEPEPRRGYYARERGYELPRQTSPEWQPMREMPGERGYSGRGFSSERYGGGFEREGLSAERYGRGYERESFAPERYRPGDDREAFERLGFYGEPAGRASARSGAEDASPAWSYTEVWLIEGPFTGRGPQDYRRSDERIMEDVCERLTQHGQLDAGDMEVSVSDGEVTLEGTVPDRRSKRMAEDTAYTVWGVSDVQNRLKVRRGREETRESPLGGVNLEL